MVGNASIKYLFISDRHLLTLETDRTIIVKIGTNMIASHIIAHRGCAALAPENTLAAMQLTKSLGVEWVEIDANLLGDGTVVIFHDDTLERLSSRSDKLTELTHADLTHIDVGSHLSVAYKNERICTLDQMLCYLSELNLGLNLEIKRYDTFTPEQIVMPCIEAINKHWKDSNRLIISSFDLEILKLFQQHKPDWQLGVLWEELPENWKAIASSINPISIHLEAQSITLTQAQAIKKSGYDLYTYTVNNATEADALCSMGVDGVFTDDPTRL